MDTDGEVNEKIDRLVHMLSTHGAGGILINGRHNFAWLTAGGSNTVDITREAGVASLLVRADGKAFVLASRIEMQRLLNEQIPAGKFEPIEYAWEQEKASSTFVIDRAARLLTGKPLVADVFVGETVQILESPVARCRYQLTESEVERYRALGSDAGQAIVKVVDGLQPGITEKEIASQVDAALSAFGARGVVTLVGTDDRIRRFRHPVPTSRQWQQTLLIALCAQRAGLTVAITRIVCAGSVPDELQTRTQATARVNAQLLSHTRPGVSGRDLYEVAARAYADEGVAGEQHLHHQGGAIGYRTRDWVAHPACDEVVQVNQTFAWNPSITGAKVEETCLVTEQGIEVLTFTPDWPHVAVSVNGSDYSAPDVLSV